VNFKKVTRKRVAGPKEELKTIFADIKSLAKSKLAKPKVKRYELESAYKK